MSAKRLSVVFFIAAVLFMAMSMIEEYDTFKNFILPKTGPEIVFPKEENSSNELYEMYRTIDKFNRTILAANMNGAFDNFKDVPADEKIKERYIAEIKHAIQHDQRRPVGLNIWRMMNQKFPTADSAIIQTSEDWKYSGDDPSEIIRIKMVYRLKKTKSGWTITDVRPRDVFEVDR